MSMKTEWSLEDAVELCKHIEDVCPKFGCHVALTGGTLYKEGYRKDLDLLFYRIRQKPKIDMTGLWAALQRLGVVKKSGFGWCYKAIYGSRKIDCLFPEERGGADNPSGPQKPVELNPDLPVEFNPNLLKAS